MADQPSKAQWDEIAERLDQLYGAIYLRCDGYLVGAMLGRVGTNHLAITVTVNGWTLKGEWLPLYGREMSEEARRFWRPKRRQKMSLRQLKLYEKLYGKRECQRRGYYEPTVWPMPLWLRPRPFIAHLKKNNQRIEIIDSETYYAAVKALPTPEVPDA